MGLTKVVLDPSKWDRGRDFIDADAPEVVLVGDKMDCCLGFAGCVLGVPRKTMKYVYRPDMLPNEEREKFIEAGIHGEAMWSLMTANDMGGWTDKRRVKELNTIAKEFGLSLRFELKKVEDDKATSPA